MPFLPLATEDERVTAAYVDISLVKRDSYVDLFTRL